MKPLLVLLLCSMSVMVGLQAKAAVWHPSGAHTQIPIWPGTPPDAHPVPGPEYITEVKNPLVAGKPWHKVGNVSRPTMTIYPPEGKDTGAAVIVFPGGGFRILAIDLEGTEVCHWLTSIGVTCVLLKYRVPSEPYSWKCHCYNHGHGGTATSVPSLQDAQRTIRLVRYHAARWHVNPKKIGVIGFSAGGFLVAETSTEFNREMYKPVDPADKVSDRPDFALAIYPGHIITPKYKLNPNLHFTRETPPTFVLQAEDAKVDSVQESLVYYTALEKAGVRAELHIYAKGGHAFGLRPTKLPITHWPKLADTWLHTIGMIGRR